MTDKCIICNEKIDTNADLISMNLSKLERDSIYKKIINEKKKSKDDKMLGKKRANDIYILMTECFSKYGIKTNLSLNDINPFSNPGTVVLSLFLSLLVQRSYMKRYLLIKARTLSTFAFFVNYSCFYYGLFNAKEMYKTYKNLNNL
jgi:hypothetical protein